MITTKPKNISKAARIIIPSLLILVWFAIGGLGGPYFGKISDVSSNDQSTFLPVNAESTKVNNEIEKFRDTKSIPAIIVFTNGDKNISNQTLSEIKGAQANIKRIPGVTGEISPPLKSENGKAALLIVETDSDRENETITTDIKAALQKSDISAEYKVSGPVGFLEDLKEAFSGIDGLLLGVALAVVFVILLVVYRSPVLPFLVLINSMFALCAAILIVFYLAKAGVLTLNGQVQGILFILVIGAATDYALLFVSRYREELINHAEAYKAIIVSWKRSLEPILAAGGTVIAGLLCLLLSDLSSNKALGPVGAIGIALSIIATLTLLPSLLVVWGRKVFWPRIPHYEKSKNTKAAKETTWSRVARLVTSRPRPVWIITTAMLLVLTLGLTQLKADGVAQSDFILSKSEARDGQQLINKHFPGGSGTPAQIIIPERHLEATVKKLEADTGVASVAAVANNSAAGTIPLGKEEERIKQRIRSGIEQKAGRELPGIDRIVAAAYPFKDASPKVIDNEVLLEVTLNDDADSKAAQATIQRLRLSLDAIDPAIQVGGTSAVQLDTLKSGEHDRMVVIPAVLVVITVILMVLLRSILAPVLLLATTVLSFAAILGLSAVVFNHIFNFPGADPSVVLYGFVFLVALGIDYNIFLMTRVREESLRSGTRRGVVLGLVATGSVITSAGIVLAATFAALAVIPILFLVQLAFIVSLGVLIDTVVIRSILVPSLVYDIGKRVWWPSKKHKD